LLRDSLEWTFNLVDNVKKLLSLEILILLFQKLENLRQEASLLFRCQLFSPRGICLGTSDRMIEVLNFFPCLQTFT